MNIQFYTPPFPLNNFVELFTFYEGYYPIHRMERLLPEGVVEIIIDLTPQPKFIYDNTSLEEKQACKKAWVSGFRKEFISISALPNSSMLVIRFRPGMASPFLQIPLNEITEKVIDADLIFGNEILQLRNTLMETKTVDRKFKLVEKFLLKRAGETLELHPSFLHVLNEIIKQPTVLSIDHAVTQSGHSHKHIVSLFHRYLGTSPKQFLRILRFQRTIRHINQPMEINWMDIAYQCGYYDQAHFIKDFKRFSGFTPTQFRQLKGRLKNYIPIK